MRSSIFITGAAIWVLSAAMSSAAGEEGAAANAAGVKETASQPPGWISEPPPIPQDMFEEAIEQQLPGSPDQIRNYRVLREKTEKAKNEEVLPVTPVISTTIINLDKKIVPPVLRLRVGYSTTLVFRDASGAPYKVTPFGFGDNKAYKVLQISDNALTLYATKAYRPSNMTVMLDGVDEPLVLHLTNGGQEVDYVRTFSISRLAPATREKLALAKGQADPLPVVNDEALTRFLDRIIPPEAQIVPVLEPDVEAWWFRGKLIVRTRMILLSPEGTPLNGSNGIRVYEILAPMSTLLFADKKGREVEVHLVLDQVDMIAGNAEDKS